VRGTRRRPRGYRYRFDGGGGVTGLDDAADYARITEPLLKEGYTPEDLQKIWSGNVLRVLRAAESAAQTK
jgi:membrane dipeptidase